MMRIDIVQQIILLSIAIVLKYSSIITALLSLLKFIAVLILHAENADSTDIPNIKRVKTMKYFSSASYSYDLALDFS